AEIDFHTESAAQQFGGIGVIEAALRHPIDFNGVFSRYTVNLISKSNFDRFAHSAALSIRDHRLAKHASPIVFAGNGHKTNRTGCGAAENVDAQIGRSDLTSLVDLHHTLAAVADIHPIRRKWSGITLGAGE